MLKKLSTILSAKELRKFKLIFALNFLMFILETLSIISIPLFASVLIDPTLVLNKISFYFPESYFLYLDASNILYISSGFVIISFLLKNSFLLFLLYFQGHFFKDIKINISRKLFNYYVYLPYLEHVEKDPSTLARNITGEIHHLNTYLTELAVFIRESSAVLVIFLILISVQPLIVSLVCILFSLIGFVYLRLVKPVVKNKAEQNQLLSKNIFQIIYETFGSIKDIKILMKEKEIVNYFDRDIKILEKNNFYFSVIERLPKIFLELISVATITVITLVFFNFNQDYSKFFPMLALLVICVFRFIPAFNGITVSRYFMRRTTPSLNLLYKEIKIIDQFLDKNLNYSEKNENNINKLDKFNYFDIKNLSFSYSNNKIVQLNNINMSLKKGSMIGITGKTGSGKSTLFHLMLGLIKPKEGDIFYNGESIFNNLNKWREKIGYISQNVFLLNSSIKNNVTFNFLEEAVDSKKLETAINITQLNEKITSLPNGIDTNVGSGGLKLSGGERQRIALARALYRDPEIYFMDESTSSLDANTEKLILEAIKKDVNDKTVILIAHRKTTLDKCDEVLTLKDGSFS